MHQRKFSLSGLKNIITRSESAPRQQRPEESKKPQAPKKFTLANLKSKVTAKKVEAPKQEVAKKKNDSESDSSSSDQDVRHIFASSVLDNQGNGPQNVGSMFLKIKYLEQENRNLS